MIDLKIAMSTNLLLVDDDIDQQEVRALILKMSGFTVLAAGSPVEAISIMAQHPVQKVDVAILDYHMPVMNGCVLAEYLKSRYPELKIILHSAALDISQSEMTSVDVVSKSEGITPLLAQVSELVQAYPMGPDAVFAHESNWAEDALF